MGTFIDAPAFKGLDFDAEELFSRLPSVSQDLEAWLRDHIDLDLEVNSEHSSHSGDLGLRNASHSSMTAGSNNDLSGRNNDSVTSSGAYGAAPSAVPSPQMQQVLQDQQQTHTSQKSEESAGVTPTMPMMPAPVTIQAQGSGVQELLAQLQQQQSQQQQAQAQQPPSLYQLFNFPAVEAPAQQATAAQQLPTAPLPQVMAAGQQGGLLPVASSYLPLLLQQGSGQQQAMMLVSHNGQIMLAPAGPLPANAPTVQPTSGKATKPPPKRFRERQRELIASLEQEVSEKLAQLQMLSAENEALKLKSNVLQSAVTGRERQMEVYREYGPPVFEHPPKDNNSAADSAPCGVKQPCGGAEPGKLPAAVQKRCIQKLKYMSAGQIRSYWKMFLAEASEELLRQEGPNGASLGAVPSAPSAPEGTCGEARPLEPEVVAAGPVAIAAAERMGALVDRYGYYVKHVALLNPGSFLQMFCLNLDTGEPEVPSDDHWRSVLARLGLADWQLRDIMVCWDLYQRGCAKIWAEREQLTLRMSQASEGQSTACEKARNGGTGVNCTAAVDAMFLANEALGANLRKEHSMRILLNCFFWNRLSALQFVRATVHSWPFFPDVHAIVSIIIADAGGQAASNALLSPDAAGLAIGRAANGGGVLVSAG